MSERTNGLLKRRGLLAGAAALVGAGLAKLGGAERAEAAHGAGVDPEAIHRHENNTATATTTLRNTNAGGGTALLVESTDPSASGVHGANNTATGVGVHGSSSLGVGVFGLTLGDGKPGVSGVARGAGGVGIQGWASGDGASYAVQGIRESGNLGAAVRGDVNPFVGADAVQGAARSGTGVLGTSETGTGVRGQATAAPGVHGRATGSAATSIGVLGEATGASGATAGVLGRVSSPAGIGVRGEATGGQGVFGLSTSSYGVFGGSSSNVGVYGNATRNAGVFGASPIYGVWGRTNMGLGVNGEAVGGGVGVYGKAPAASGGWAGYFDGNVYVTGRLFQGGTASPQAMSAQTVESFGETQLVNGAATVTLDQETAEAVSGERYQVFLTPYDQHKALVVTRRGPAGFDVRAEGAPNASGPFGWRVVARRTQANGQDRGRGAAPQITIPQDVPVPTPPELPTGEESTPRPDDAPGQRREGRQDAP